MKRSIIILLAIVTGLVIWAISSQRSLVSKDEGVNAQFANVQAAYQKRFDLVDNLVEVVKGEADFERGTLTDVINARANATKITLNVDDLSEENLKKFQDAQQGLSGALNRLMVVSEQYPTLRANESFRKLQDNLVEMENQIKRAREDFNESVKTYNVAVRSFPGSVMAMVLGFEKKAAFQADQGASTAPKIKMNHNAGE